jgi:hypothetical protein
MNLPRSGWFRIVAVVALLLATVGVASAAAPSGAVWTTNAGCAAVNGNIYDSKADVFVNGGPKGGSAGLDDGSYWVQVTEPNGAVLGVSAGADVQVIDGTFSACYNLFALTNYADTTNPGGEYKVWVSMNSAFPPSESKTDNFKVKQQATFSQLSVVKFYDANANGVNDDSQPVAGWKINVLDLWTNTSADYWTPVDITLTHGSYKVSEYLPVQTNWMPTTATWQNVTLPPNAYVEFGNLCVGAGGGKTLGFWSNKNGAAMLGADDLAKLALLNLRNADGSNFDPASVKVFQPWLLSANANNMANMLSAQMAAMFLNVYNGLVNGNALIYAPGATSANALGYATVNAVIAEANASLGANGLTVAGGAVRSYQEALKNALDKANNNTNFVQPIPCPFSF